MVKTLNCQLINHIFEIYFIWSAGSLTHTNRIMNPSQVCVILCEVDWIVVFNQCTKESVVCTVKLRLIFSSTYTNMPASSKKDYRSQMMIFHISEIIFILWGVQVIWLSYYIFKIILYIQWKKDHGNMLVIYGVFCWSIIDRNILFKSRDSLCQKHSVKNPFCFPN